MAACKDSYGWICEGDCEEVKVKDRVMGGKRGVRGIYFSPTRELLHGTYDHDSWGGVW
jgi:hypothetical protein